jgi:transcriptional regulator with XRE-family HTH domain
MDYTEFWKRTNELIKLQSKTQRGLALECGFTERRIETLSSNNRSPDVIEAVKIAEALNTSVEFLVSGNTPTFPKDESKEKAAALAQEIINLLK